MANRLWYSVSGSIERRSGYDWQYDGSVKDELTAATSSAKAKQNVLYRYVVEKKGLVPGQVRLFRFFHCTVRKLDNDESEQYVTDISKDSKGTDDDLADKQLRLF